MTKQLKSLNNEKDQIVEHNKMKIEEMHLALNTTRNDLSSANEKIHLLSSEKCDLDGKLSSIIKEKKIIEQDLKEKVCTGFCENYCHPMIDFCKTYKITNSNEYLLHYYMSI